MLLALIIDVAKSRFSQINTVVALSSLEYATRHRLLEKHSTYARPRMGSWGVGQWRQKPHPRIGYWFYRLGASKLCDRDRNRRVWGTNAFTHNDQDT